MNKKYLLTISIIIITITSACGGSAEPTISAEAIAQTAVAEAWLAITQTQAAMPTPTIQPTSTPEPTLVLLPTLPPLPTLSGQTPVSVAPTTDPCNQVPPIEPQGKVVRVEIKNEAQGPANLGFGMNSPNDKNECVTYSFEIGVGKVAAQNVLIGCYWGYAWINGAEVSNARTGGTLLCLTDANQTYHVRITKETISLY